MYQGGATVLGVTSGTLAATGFDELGMVIAAAVMFVGALLLLRYAMIDLRCDEVS